LQKLTQTSEKLISPKSYRSKTRISRTATFVLLFLFLKTAFSSAMANENNWEFWNTNCINTRLSEKLRVQMQKQFRFRSGELIYHDTDLTFYHRFSSKFSAGVGYRQGASKKGDDWEIEDRLALSGTFRIKLKEFNLTNRNKLEYRMFEPGEKNSYRYRTRIRLSYPIESKIKLDPFIANEFFFDLKPRQQSRFNRNRFYLGVSAEPIKNFDVDVFYLNQNSLSTANSTEKWSDKNIMGLNMRYRF
jgi:hypothetical protein